MDEVVSKIRLAASELNVTSANEATTRFKLIDIVLSELLGWNREDIEVEDRVSEDGIGEFSDYIISTRQHSILIEAKKVGSNFEGVPKGRKALLKGSWLAKPVGNPVRQARDYGRKKGVGFCIATNGMTWVAFPVNRRDQVTFDESTCIVFQDINSLIDEVDWQLTSIFWKNVTFKHPRERDLTHA
jgi:predicted type IV restriction endonuclease